MQKQGQITTLLKEILVDLHYHIAGLAWLIQGYLVLVKKIKKIRTNIQNSVEVGLCHITHSLSFVYSNSELSDQLFYSYKFYLCQNVYIYIICILFASN